MQYIRYLIFLVALVLMFAIINDDSSKDTTTNNQHAITNQFKMSNNREAPVTNHPFNILKFFLPQAYIALNEK